LFRGFKEGKLSADGRVITVVGGGGGMFWIGEFLSMNH